jgi:hypothetical protein
MNRPPIYRPQVLMLDGWGSLSIYMVANTILWTYMRMLFGYCLNQTPIFNWCAVRCGSKEKRNNHTFKRNWTMFSNFVLTILHLIVKTIGRTHVFSQGINKNALPLTIIKLRKNRCLIWLCWCLDHHRIFANVIQVSLCKSDQ